MISVAVKDRRSGATWKTGEGDAGCGCGWKGGRMCVLKDGVGGWRVDEGMGWGWGMGGGR